METLLVIDGNSILNRAYYGIRPLSNKNGLPTNAVYGFLTIIKKHMDALLPDRVVCTFDQKSPTFRHKMYSGYKATRRGMPEELALQLPYALHAAQALGCHTPCLPGYEADDVIGTVCAKAAETHTMRAYVLTGDRDSLQLISDTTTVILVKTKEDILYTESLFRQEYGISPAQFVDVKALMGDTSDNIPGVPGIGEKTALKLIATAGSLDAVYENPDALGITKSVREKLLAGKESAYLSRKLAEICRTVPLDTPLPPNLCVPDREALCSLFDELEFTALKARFGLTASVRETVTETPMIPEFPPYVTGELPDDGSPIVLALDENQIGIVFQDCCRRLESYAELGEILKNHPVYCHDYKKYFTVLRHRGISVSCLMDTMLAAYLIAPGENIYPLEKLILQYLGISAEVTTPEAEAYYVSLLVPVLREKLTALGMIQLLTDMEIPLAECLSEMEEAGFYLDAAGLHAYISALQEQAEELAERIYAAAGKRFNINSPKQLGEILFEHLGLPSSKKTRTGYATDAETLSKLRACHPIIHDILDYRQLVKLCGTYGDNLIALRGDDGKIHSRFNQTGTATGRLSSADPNMQNIPVRGQLGREMRKFFCVSDPDYVLLDADYSQIELRLLAEISGDENMCRSFFEGRDIHRDTASQVFHVAPDEVSSELRLKAKAVNFGIVYGIGDYSLSQDLDISRRQAALYIRNYLESYPGVDAYLKSSVENARQTGCTVTLFGRRRFIPELVAQNKNVRAFGERVAMNSPIQGTAADIIKIAMIRTREALQKANLDARLILQVHDELIIEAHRSDAEAAAQILKQEMEHAVSLRVPLTVEISSGSTWYEAKQ